MLDAGYKKIITFQYPVSPPASPEGEVDPPAMQGTSGQVAGRQKPASSIFYIRASPYKASPIISILGVNV
jgi:hypothetical protein